jgi:hypothetical protein
MKPPKIFTEASNTAIKPITFEKLSSNGPAAISAPTIMTEEIAFVTLIRGECKAAVTFQTT